MKRAIQYSLAALLGAFLVGCGGGSSSSDPSTDETDTASSATLDGRAAVGAPIAGATVSARCADGSGFIDEVTTDSSGRFSGRVESDALPCALRVTGGGEEITLHSYTESAGTVNITPLTDMIIALSSSLSPQDWFDRDDRNALMADREARAQELMAALRGSSYNIPDDEFDPFRTPFNIGDSIDQVLDALWEAIAALPTVDNYPAFLDLIAGGNLAALPEAPPGHGGGEDPNGDGDVGGGGDMPVVGGGSAAACFNPFLASPGAQLEMRFQFTPPFGQPLVETVVRMEGSGETTFRGETVQVIDGEVVVEGPQPNLATRVYVSVDEAALVFSDHGDESFDADGAIERTTWFEPTQDFRYDLNPGESYRQAYTVYSQSPDEDPSENDFMIDKTVTYAGRETVTVPAGTFEACKFYTQNTSSPSTEAQVTWENVGDGILVQSGTRDSTGTEQVHSVLLSYAINGVQQAP